MLKNRFTFLLFCVNSIDRYQKCLDCFDDARGKKTFCLSNNACINTIGRKYCPFSKDINNRNKCACLSSKRSKNCADCVEDNRCYWSVGKKKCLIDNLSTFNLIQTKEKCLDEIKAEITEESAIGIIVGIVVFFIILSFVVPILCCVCVGCCIAQNVEPTGRRAQYVIQQPQRQQVMTETIGSPHVQYSIQHRHPISSVEAIV